MLELIVSYIIDVKVQQTPDGEHSDDSEGIRSVSSVNGLALLLRNMCLI